MVRIGDVLSTVATVALSVNKLMNVGPSNGVPKLKVLYTSDQKEALSFLNTNLDKEVIGLDMSWKPPSLKAPHSRSSLLQLSSGRSVLLFDLLPHPDSGRWPVLPRKMCAFLEQPNRTFYDMFLTKHVARIAFELNCVIKNGVDLSYDGRAWPGERPRDISIVSTANQVLHTKMPRFSRSDKMKLEARPLSSERLKFLAQKTYATWALASHFIKKQGAARDRSHLSLAMVYREGEILRSKGLPSYETRFNWTWAKQAWAEVQAPKRILPLPTRKQRKALQKAYEALEAAAAGQNETKDSKRPEKQLRKKSVSAKKSGKDVDEAKAQKSHAKRNALKAKKAVGATASAGATKELSPQAKTQKRRERNQKRKEVEAAKKAEEAATAAAEAAVEAKRQKRRERISRRKEAKAARSAEEEADAAVEAALKAKKQKRYERLQKRAEAKSAKKAEEEAVIALKAQKEKHRSRKLNKKEATVVKKAMDEVAMTEAARKPKTRAKLQKRKEAKLAKKAEEEVAAAVEAAIEAKRQRRRERNLKRKEAMAAKKAEEEAAAVAEAALEAKRQKRRERNLRVKEAKVAKKAQEEAAVTAAEAKMQKQREKKQKRKDARSLDLAAEEAAEKKSKRTQRRKAVLASKQAMESAAAGKQKTQSNKTPTGKKSKRATPSKKSVMVA